MLRRIEQLEKDGREVRERLIRIEARMDEAFKAFATKADLSESANRIIMWVVGTVLLAQILPPLLRKFGLG